MKVLFIGSRARSAAMLKLEREITELQRRFSMDSGLSVAFKFLPDTNVEELASEVSSFEPDILHLSVHGRQRALEFSSFYHGKASLTEEGLATLLSVSAPKLVYLNACNSWAIAERLSKNGLMAIGMTAPITNGAACASAALFYECLLKGMSVRKSFEVSAAIVRCLSDKKTRAEIFPRGKRFKDLVLHRVPQILARFTHDDFKRRNGEYQFDLGIIGCPIAAQQVIFFTDDDELAEENRKGLEYGLSTVARSTSVRGQLWEEDAWSCFGDCRLYACGTTASGAHFFAATTLVKAIEGYFAFKQRGIHRPVPNRALKAIRNLQRNDGSDRPGPTS